MNEYLNKLKSLPSVNNITNLPGNIGRSLARFGASIAPAVNEAAGAAGTGLTGPLLSSMTPSMSSISGRIGSALGRGLSGMSGTGSPK